MIMMAVCQSMWHAVGERSRHAQHLYLLPYSQSTDAA